MMDQGLYFLILKFKIFTFYQFFTHVIVFDLLPTFWYENIFNVTFLILKYFLFDLLPTFWY